MKDPYKFTLLDLVVYIIIFMICLIVLFIFALGG